jgi:alkylated DNA nucleotide flippase Atl1
MTKYERSSQIWGLLICAAKDRKTYKYGDVAKILGFGGAGVLGQFLGPIMNYCEANDLPPITVLIVNQETGLPSEGLVALEEVNLDREAVFKEDWFSLNPPQNSDFGEANQKK